MATTVLWVAAAFLSLAVGAAGAGAQNKLPADLGLSPVRLPQKEARHNLLGIGDTECQYQERTGSCYGAIECLVLAGSYGNFCGFAGLCCLFLRHCGMRTSQRTAYFLNHQFPNSEQLTEHCTMNIIKRSEEYCGVRVTMQKASLPEPTNRGVCNDASYSVSGLRKNVPAKCGDLTGNVYTYDMQDTDELTLHININAQRSNLNWQMMVQQIPCTEYNSATETGTGGASSGSDTGAGTGSGSGSSPGSGSGSSSGTGSGSSPDDGPSAGPDAGSGTGSGTGSSPDTGSGTGSGSSPGTGSGSSPGTGSGSSPGTGSGSSPGTGSGSSPGTGSGSSPDVGPSAGPDAGSGTGSGTGSSPDTDTGFGTGSGSGTVSGPDSESGFGGPTGPAIPPGVSPPAPPPPTTSASEGSKGTSFSRCGVRGSPYTTVKKKPVARRMGALGPFGPDVLLITGRRKGGYPRPGSTFRAGSNYRRRRPSSNRRPAGGPKGSSSVGQTVAVLPEPAPPTPSVTSDEWAAPTRNNTLLYEYLGERSIWTNRITYGELAGVKEFPWQVAMTVNGKFHCGGCIISDQHVLTAAHCVTSYTATPGKLDLALGDWDLKATNDGRHVKAKVETVRMHAKYNSATLQNDVAVLKLTSKITFTENIQAICLPTTDLQTAGKRAIVSGWGRNERQRLQTQLQYLEATIVTNVKCDQRWHTMGAPNGFIVGSMMCMDSTFGDSCNGDSGGPSVMEDPPNSGSFVLVGLVSFGSGSCVDEKLPGVYTRVSHFRDWIKANMI